MTDLAARVERRTVGWREWVSLPALGIDRIKAKFDSGARTSALHAANQEIYEEGGRTWVRFCAYPIQRDDETVVRCAAPVADRRWVTNSGGDRERRYVIATLLDIGGASWEVELTLTSRDQLGFRMLIGREAMRGRLVVDPARSFCLRRGKGKAGSRRTRQAGETPRRKDE